MRGLRAGAAIELFVHGERGAERGISGENRAAASPSVAEEIGDELETARAGSRHTATKRQFWDQPLAIINFRRGRGRER